MHSALPRTSVLPRSLEHADGGADPLELFIRPSIIDAGPSLRDTEISPEATLLKFAPETRHVLIRFPIGNLRIELPCSEERSDQGASIVVAASAQLNPYRSAVLRQQMARSGQTRLEQMCESIEIALIHSDVTSSGAESLRRQKMVLGSSLFHEDHPSYSIKIGPVSLKLVLFDGEDAQGHGAPRLRLDPPISRRRAA